MDVMDSKDYSTGIPVTDDHHQFFLDKLFELDKLSDNITFVNGKHEEVIYSLPNDKLSNTHLEMYRKMKEKTFS